MNVIGQPQIGLGIDPHASRLLEETAAVVNDVDQRLTALKVGISQAMPHLANVLLWKEQLAFTNPIARTAGGLGASPIPSFGGYPLTGLGSPFLPGNPSLLGSIGAFPQPWGSIGGLGGPLYQLVPVTPGSGVTNPFGIVSPFRPF